LPKFWGWLGDVSEKESAILTMLHQEDIATANLSIDSNEYRDFFLKAEYPQRYPSYYPSNIIEKSLEHFIAQKLLSLSPDDVYIDIASEHSPVPEIYSRLYGCHTYAQDLSYKPGLHGKRIGGDAASMPVPNGYANKMALHCSFEHFEGDSDIGFIRECSRVLSDGGAAIVVPLYLNDVYAILTDPIMSVLAFIPFEDDAILFCAKNYRNRHGRFYDPRHLRTRIIQNNTGLRIKVIHIINCKSIHNSCYAHFALLIEKPVL
jgi:hypothetical protein